LYKIKEPLKDCRSKVYIIVGEKENKMMKKSAQMIHQTIEHSILHVLPGLYHGEFSINYSKDYVAKINEMISL
jgi:hypothetical protein